MPNTNGWVFYNTLIIYQACTVTELQQHGVNKPFRTEAEKKWLDDHDTCFHCCEEGCPFAVF